jgi:hypothetical protein
MRGDDNGGQIEVRDALEALEEAARGTGGDPK